MARPRRRRTVRGLMVLRRQPGCCRRSLQPRRSARRWPRDRRLRPLLPAAAAARERGGPPGEATRCRRVAHNLFSSRRHRSLRTVAGNRRRSKDFPADGEVGRVRPNACAPVPTRCGRTSAVHVSLAAPASHFREQPEGSTASNPHLVAQLADARELASDGHKLLTGEPPEGRANHERPIDAVEQTRV